MLFSCPTRSCVLKCQRTRLSLWVQWLSQKAVAARLSMNMYTHTDTNQNLCTSRDEEPVLFSPTSFGTPCLHVHPQDPVTRFMVYQRDGTGAWQAWHTCAGVWFKSKERTYMSTY